MDCKCNDIHSEKVRELTFFNIYVNRQNILSEWLSDSQALIDCEHQFRDMNYKVLHLHRI